MTGAMNEARSAGVWAWEDTGLSSEWNVHQGSGVVGGEVPGVGSCVLLTHTLGG